MGKPICHPASREELTTILEIYANEALCLADLPNQTCPPTASHFCEPPDDWDGDAEYDYAYGPRCISLGVPGWGAVCNYVCSPRNTCELK